MAFDGTDWDETKPAADGVISEGDDYIRDFKLAVRKRLEKEHLLPAGSTVGGEHLGGSAKVFVVADYASLPTKRPDTTTTLDIADAGRLAITLDTGTVYYWRWDSVGGTGAWTPVRAPFTMIRLTISVLDEDPTEFTTGMVCTQTTSGAVGAFLYKDTTYFYVSLISGTFDGTNVVTGTGDTPPTITPSAVLEVDQVPIIPEKYFKIVETASGAFPTGTWYKRFQTATIDRNPSTLISIVNGQVVVPAGTYRFRITCPAYGVGKHRARLWNSTSDTLVAEGTIADANGIQSISEICGRFAVTEESILITQDYCTTAGGSQGLGLAASPIPAGRNIYSVWEMWKENV